MNRYIRQETLSEIGQSGQARLAASRVLVVGAGGLAAAVLPLLTAAGIGRIRIVDSDLVDLSNLHRQTIFTEADVGRSKAEVAAERCRALNSEVTVVPWRKSLTAANAAELVGSADVVVDCADNYATSYILNDVCSAAAVPLITASVLGRAGYVGGFCGTSPCLRAVFPDAPRNAANCSTAGVMGPVVGLLGAAQAQLVMGTLLDFHPSPLGQMITVDMESFRFSGFRFDGAPSPTAFFPFVALTELEEDDVIVDLRPESEAPSRIHPKARRILPESLQDDLQPIDKRLVLACATGLRSWRAAEDIQDIWPGEIVLVAAAAS